MQRPLLTVLILASLSSVATEAQQPSFDCAKAAGTVEQMICADEVLTALDLRMAQVWDEAMITWAGTARTSSARGSPTLPDPG